MIIAGVLAAGTILIGALIWALILKEGKRARAEQRNEFTESNEEAAHNAEKILDGPKLSLAQRRARATRRRQLRHAAATAGLSDDTTEPGHDGGGDGTGDDA